MITKKTVGILILALLFIMGFKYLSNPEKTKPNSTTPTSTPVAIQNSDQAIVNDLVNNFYTALESQDGKVLFRYFTPPTTSQEKSDFNWLTGADLADGPFYRAFLRLKVSDPKITALQMVNDTTFVVKITDQLLVLPSAGSEKTVFSPRLRNVVLTVIKVDDKWLVDKFTDPSKTTALNTSTTKYSGFGQ